MIVNPFSPDAERIIKRQKEETVLSSEVQEHAKKLVDWKAVKKKKKTIPPNLIKGYNEEIDLLSQRLLFLTLALQFTPYSNELRLIREAIEALVKARLSSLLSGSDDKVLIGLMNDQMDIRTGTPTFDGGMRFGDVQVGRNELFSQAELRYGGPWKVRYAVSWRELIPIIKARMLRFTDLYLVSGLALVSLKDLIDYYSSLISVKMENFIGERFEDFQAKGRKEELESLVTRTAPLADHLTNIAGKTYTGSVIQGKAGRLKPGKFPPCIKSILAGVQTGSRNYAISVLLTSFISYARAAPGKVQNPRIVDYIKDPKVVTDEILPLIYEAAARCNPPLFDDQPMEKMNVMYHLGLGLSSEVKLENSGSSSWYFPPNCEKIRRESPGLCHPDETCKKIKNPLTYYFVKPQDQMEPEPE